MQRTKAVEIIGYSRQRLKAIGCMIWTVMLVTGIIGMIFWKWYSLILVFIAGYVSASVYSHLQSKRIERITGLNIYEQEIAYRESLVALSHPITKHPDDYKEYIDSIPDEEEIL